MQKTYRRRPRVAISQGDYNGISYELLLKVFADERILELATPIVYGSAVALDFWTEKLGLEPQPWRMIVDIDEAKESVINLLVVGDEKDVRVQPGQASQEAGLAAYLALERATSDVASGKADFLLTAPINKSTMPKDLFPYSGHTPYLEHLFATTPDESLMLLVSGECRVALVTEHVPLSEVAARLSIARIVHKAQLLNAGLSQDFGIVKPRIAVLALNPHSGDNGLIGDEEDTLIRPALEELQSRGIMAFGPYPADGFWGSDRVDSFDAVLAMYHDQGLAPFKSLYMNEGVNTTLGLSIIRTSPDHGTGYDLAGQGVASPDSLRSALYLGIDMLRTRRRQLEARANPLKRHYHTRGRDDERLPASLEGEEDKH